MLPPIPQNLVPVTVQQDPPKPRPTTPPVVPAQAGAGSRSVALGQEHEEEVWLDEKYQRHRQRRGGTRDAAAQAEGSPENVLENVVSDESPRKGLWIDIEV